MLARATQKLLSGHTYQDQDQPGYIFFSVRCEGDRGCLVRWPWWWWCVYASLLMVHGRCCGGSGEGGREGVRQGRRPMGIPWPISFASRSSIRSFVQWIFTSLVSGLSFFFFFYPLPLPTHILQTINARMHVLTYAYIQ